MQAAEAARTPGAAQEHVVPAWMGHPVTGSAPAAPRPMSVTELLDQGFAVLRAEYRTLAPIIVTVAGPLALLSAVASRSALRGTGNLGVFSTSGFGATAGHGGWAAVIDAVALLWPAFVAGPVCRVASAHWFGRRQSRRAAWTGMRRIPALLVAVIVADALVAVGFLLFFLPGVVAWVMFHLMLPVMVVEGRGPFRAVGRSTVLATRRFWAVLGVCALGLLVDQAVAVLLGLVPGAVVALLGLRWGFIVEAAGAVAVETVTWSWSMIVLTLVYLDVRARTEGLDLVVRADQGGA